MLLTLKELENTKNAISGAMGLVVYCMAIKAFYSRDLATSPIRNQCSFTCKLLELSGLARIEYETFVSVLCYRNALV